MAWVPRLTPGRTPPSERTNEKDQIDWRKGPEWDREIQTYLSVYKPCPLLTFPSLCAVSWGCPLGLLALLVDSVLLLLLAGADRIVRSSLTSPPARFTGSCTAAGHLQPLAANGSAVFYLAPAAGAASTGIWIWAGPFPARSSYLGGVSSESTPRRESEGDCKQKHQPCM